jgi:hypothetical protein
MTGSPAPSSSGAATNPRPAYGFKAVWAVFFGSLVAAALVGLGIYFFVLRYVPVLHRHVPPDAAVAVRLDLEQVVMFEPARKHLLPLAEGTRAADGRTRVERLADGAGIQLARDIRELGLVVGPRKDEWLLLAGGFFRRGAVPELTRVLASEAPAWQLAADGVARGPGGLALTQADDGVLILGSSEEGVLRARHLSSGSEALRAGAWSVLARDPQLLAEGSLALPMQVRVVLGGNAAQLEPTARVLRLQSALSAAGLDDLPGQGAARVAANEGGVEAEWSAAELDRAVALFASRLSSLAAR